MDTSCGGWLVGGVAEAGCGVSLYTSRSNPLRRLLLIWIRAVDVYILEYPVAYLNLSNSSFTISEPEDSVRHPALEALVIHELLE